MLDVPRRRLLGPLPDKPAVAEEPLHDILRVSEMANELPWLQSMEISSLIADSASAIAVDVAIEVRPLAADHGRYGHMAIFPIRRRSIGRTAEGRQPLRRARSARRTPRRCGFSCAICQRARKRLRFFSTLSELPQQQLARYAQIDYGRDMVIVAIGEADGSR